MQTFLPYRSFRRSIQTLDRQRLGKQRVETYQILRALLGQSNGWSRHPATLMWSGSEYWLAAYGVIACQRWVTEFGYRDTCEELIRAAVASSHLKCGQQRPHWLGDKRFHLSHQSNLVRKDPRHYGAQFPGVPADVPYHWPKGRR